jgi:hypothetical protein
LTCTIYIICHECSGNTYQKRPSDPVKLREYSWNLTLAYQKLLEKYRKLVGAQFGKSSEKLTVQADLDALQMYPNGELRICSSLR